MAKRFWFLSLASAALFLLGLHPLELTGLSWFGFLPLFLIVFDSRARLRDIPSSTLLAGTLYYGIGLYWLLFYEVRIYVLVFLILAPTFAIYFLLLRLVARKFQNVSVRIRASSSLWVVLHKVYALTPLGPGAVEVPFYGSLPSGRKEVSL